MVLVILHNLRCIQGNLQKFHVAINSLLRIEKPTKEMYNAAAYFRGKVISETTHQLACFEILVTMEVANDAMFG